ncbi:hypothetical protein L0P54_10725 [Anaerosalibacter bizertensis]|nr:hypothetical protein [Anaerosalibacter bizertensis]MBV1820520.1 hypothetical protein [Bacteroidales bacterium MSK.15.36]MCG4583463.1 hypothetical protein [Anaerosalibacter bizertensis]
MYLYVSFFNESNMLRGKYNLYGKYLEGVKEVFPNYLKLDKSSIKGCIGYLKGKENSKKNCFLLNINNVNVYESKLSFDFNVVQELDISNEFINKSLYKFAWRSDWVDRTTGYFPLICIVDKLDFDTIRKGTPNLKKVSSYSAELEELKGKNDWRGICNRFSPLEEVKNNKEIWDNPSDLYNLAFACSKLGEPKNGLERDKKHLKTVKKYREYSIYFYERCYELDPRNFRYPLALGYRYYLNVMELTKQKGRKDGNVNYEMTNAINWLNKTIELNPRSIKANYRKGKLIIDKKIDNFKYAPRKWTAEDFEELKEIEADGVKSLERVIDIYEKYKDDKYKSIFLREYVKALYTLGTFYLEKVELHWDYYICLKISDKKIKFDYSSEDTRYISRGKKLLEKCFEVESKTLFNKDMDVSELAKNIGKWHVSPIDKLYKLGISNLKTYFVLKMLGVNSNKIDKYGDVGEKLLLTAIEVAYEGKRQKNIRRNTNYINEKLGKYYIISERYGSAIKITKNCRQSYIKNTYAGALILSKDKNNINKAINVLKSAKEDRYNLSRELSLVLLIYTYKLSDENQKIGELMEELDGSMSKKSRKLLEVLDIGVC